MEKTIEEKIENISENEDIIHNWEPCEFKIEEDYKFVENGNIFYYLFYYVIVVPILWIVNKIIYGLKIEGKENIKNIKTGAISVSNHVLILDCSMIGLALAPRKIYYTTREGSFKIPFVRKLIKILGAIPIPTGTKNKENFIKQIKEALYSGKIIHFYPEASMWPYHDKIRNFKNGAFNLAIKSDVPVIPIVITFRNPRGIRKIFKRKKDVTLKILEPIKLEKNNFDVMHNVHKLKEKVCEAMKKFESETE